MGVDHLTGHVHVRVDVRLPACVCAFGAFGAFGALCARHCVRQIQYVRSVFHPRYTFLLMITRIKIERDGSCPCVCGDMSNSL